MDRSDQISTLSVHVGQVAPNGLQPNSREAEEIWNF